MPRVRAAQQASKPFKVRSSVWACRLGGLLGCLVLLTVGQLLAAPPEFRSSRAVSSWVFRTKDIHLPGSWCKGGAWMPIVAKEQGALAATVEAVALEADADAPHLPFKPVRLEAATCRSSAAIALAEFDSAQGSTPVWAATGTPAWGQAKAVTLFGDGALLRSAAASLGNSAPGARQGEPLPATTGIAVIDFEARLSRDEEGTPVLDRPTCSEDGGKCHRLVVAGSSRSHVGAARAGGLFRAAAARSQSLRLSRALEVAQAPQAGATATEDAVQPQLVLLQPAQSPEAGAGTEDVFRNGKEASACATGWLQAGGFQAEGLNGEAAATAEHCNAEAVIGSMGGQIDLVVAGASSPGGVPQQLAVLTLISSLRHGKETAHDELPDDAVRGLLDAAAAVARIRASVGDGEQAGGMRGSQPPLGRAAYLGWRVLGIVAQVVGEAKLPEGEHNEVMEASVLLRLIIDADGMPAEEAEPEVGEETVGKRATSMHDIAMAAMSDGVHHAPVHRGLHMGEPRRESLWPQNALVARQVGKCGGPELCLARTCEMLRTVGQSSAAAQLSGVCPRQHSLMDSVVRGVRASSGSRWDDMSSPPVQASKWESGCHQVVTQISPLALTLAPSCDHLSATSPDGSPAQAVRQSLEALALEAVEPARACTRGVILDLQTRATEVGAAPLGPGDVFEEPSRSASAEIFEDCALLGFQEVLAPHMVPKVSFSKATALAADEQALGVQIVRLVHRAALSAVSS